MAVGERRATRRARRRKNKKKDRSPRTRHVLPGVFAQLAWDAGKSRRAPATKGRDGGRPLADRSAAFRGLTSVEFLAVGIDVFHVENILEQHARHFNNCLNVTTGRRCRRQSVRRKLLGPVPYAGFRALDSEMYSFFFFFSSCLCLINFPSVCLFVFASMPNLLRFF